MDNREHFRARTREYRQSVRGASSVLYSNIGAELGRILGGVVLDVGNGGVFNYPADRLEEIIAADIIFDGKKREGRVTYIGAEASDLGVVADSSCDNVVMQFLIHHLAKDSAKETDAYLRKCLNEAFRVLRPGGRLVIIENEAGPVFEFLEGLLYPQVCAALSFLNRPMTRFYSRGSLGKRLAAAGFSDVSFKRIDMGDRVDPFLGLAPGALDIPSWAHPLRCVLAVGLKG